MVANPPRLSAVSRARASGSRSSDLGRGDRPGQGDAHLLGLGHVLGQRDLVGQAGERLGQRLGPGRVEGVGPDLDLAHHGASRRRHGRGEIGDHPAGRVRHGHQRHAYVAERTIDHRLAGLLVVRPPVLIERVAAVDLVAQLGHLLAVLLGLAEQALVHRRAQRDPDGDADGQGEEHRHQRDDVVAEVDHRARSAPAPHVKSPDPEQQVADPGHDHAPHGRPHIGEQQRGDQGQHSGQHHQHQVPGLDLAAVDPREALGVDELVLHPQPDQERGRHSGPALVQELHQRGVGADGDQQPGPLEVGQQHRRVLAGAQRRENHRGQPECGDPLHPRSAAVVVRVHHQLGAAAQGVVGAGVHVADDHVRTEPRLDQRVRAAVHPDQQRPVLADVGPQQVEVAAVVVAPDHDQHVPALDLGPHIGDADAFEQQLLLHPEVDHGVLGERLDLVRQALAGVLQLLFEDLGGVERALGDHRAVMVEQPPIVHGEPLPLVDGGEDIVADVVHQRDPGVHQDPRPQVGIAARHRGDGVDHGRHPGTRRGPRR